MSIKVKSDKQLARVATNLAIGVVGLVVVRLITQLLPMFHDAGWIVKGKLTVQAGAVIAVDALLLSVLVRFPSNKEAGLDVSHHALVSREGRGKNFFLDILFNRMSVIRILQQLPWQTTQVLITLHRNQKLP